MCGRYDLNVTRESLLAFIKTLRILKEPQVTFNATPSSALPIIVRDGDAWVLREAAWGFVPHWANAQRKVRSMINARMETIETSPMFRDAFRHSRCLVLATGFYEWQKAKGGKQPYRIHRIDGQPFCFAGLSSTHTNEGTGEVRETFAIITTPSNALLRPIHDRMPVVLDHEGSMRWLERTQDVATLKGLLQPWPPKGFEAYPVSKAVNSPENDGPELVEQVG